VFPGEPKAADHLLQETATIRRTPHIAWKTRESLDRLAEILFANMEAFLRGESLNRVR